MSYAGWTEDRPLPVWSNDDTDPVGAAATVAIYINQRSGYASVRFRPDVSVAVVTADIVTTPDGLRAIIAACAEALARGAKGGEAA